MRPKVRRFRSVHSRNASMTGREIRQKLPVPPFGIGRDREPAHEPVEHRHAPRPQPAVVAPGARAPDDVVAFEPPADELADERRRILEVGRHDDRRVAAAMVEAGRDRDVAAEVAREPERADARVRRAEPSQDIERSVAAAVVHEDEFPIVVGQRSQDVVHGLVERAEVVALVEHGHDDRDEPSRLVHRVTRLTTASITRRWSASESDAKMGRKMVRAATRSVTGSEIGPNRFA